MKTRNGGKTFESLRKLQKYTNYIKLFYEKVNRRVEIVVNNP